MTAIFITLLLAMTYFAEARRHACRGQACAVPGALAGLYLWSAWLKLWPLLT